VCWPARQAGSIEILMPDLRCRRSSRCPRLAPLIVGALLAALGSCKLVKGVAGAPSEIAHAAKGDKPKPPKMDAATLQAQVMRLADTMIMQVGDASQAFAASVGTPEARKQALVWSIESRALAGSIASQAKPFSALLDITIVIRASRTVHEHYWGPKVWGEADEPMLVAWKELEETAWQLVTMALEPEQQQDLKAALDEWSAENEGEDVQPIMRLQPFVDFMKGRGEEKAKKSGLLDLLAVDPLEGLEPAAREIAEARALGERALYVGTRMPGLLTLQIQLMTLQLAEQPTPAAVVADFGRVSITAEKIGQVAENLPEVVRVEREAAIQQISDQLTVQRAGIVSDLEKAREPLVKLLTEARGTLEAGTQLSAALDTTVKTVDQFIDGFKEPEGAATKPAEPEVPARPFDITEYTAAATELANVARELGTTIETLDRSLPQVKKVIDEAAARADQSVSRTIWLALRAVLIAIAAAALTVLLVRWISARSLRRASAV
jgi:hypothetical protein